MPRVVECRLVDDHRDKVIPYQIHALTPWQDSITREMTSYLAGFPTKEARARWVEIAGYRPITEK